MWSTVQRAIVSGEAFPSSMEVIGHHVDKIQLPVGGKSLLKALNDIASEEGLACSLGNLSYLISCVDGSFPSRHCSSQHQLRFSSCCSLSCIGLNQFLWVWTRMKNVENEVWTLRCKLKNGPTRQRRVNRCLSSGGLPRDPGYSQSRSSPSKPWVLRNLIEDWMNFWRLAGVDTVMENLQGNGTLLRK